MASGQWQVKQWREGGGVVEHDSKDNGKWTMASEAKQGHVITLVYL